MQAVASVILNRVWRGGWWGNTITTVCQKPWQFSCWNSSTDPNSNHQRMLNVTMKDADFVVAWNIAGLALDGILPDPTGGADSYYATSIDPPLWVTGNEAEGIPPATFTVEIGGQKYYRTV